MYRVDVGYQQCWVNVFYYVGIYLLYVILLHIIAISWQLGLGCRLLTMVLLPVDCNPPVLLPGCNSIAGVPLISVHTNQRYEHIAGR